MEEEFTHKEETTQWGHRGQGIVPIWRWWLCGIVQEQLEEGKEPISRGKWVQRGLGGSHDVCLQGAEGQLVFRVQGQLERAVWVGEGVGEEASKGGHVIDPGGRSSICGVPMCIE